MDTNQITGNEEVFETTVEILDAHSGKCFKVAAGIGLAVLAGVITYKYVAAPMLAKIKARKELAEIDEESVEADAQ